MFRESFLIPKTLSNSNFLALKNFSYGIIWDKVYSNSTNSKVKK